MLNSVRKVYVGLVTTTGNYVPFVSTGRISLTLKPWKILKRWNKILHVKLFCLILLTILTNDEKGLHPGNPSWTRCIPISEKSTPTCWWFDWLRAICSKFTRNPESCQKEEKFQSSSKNCPENDGEKQIGDVGRTKITETFDENASCRKIVKKFL